MDGDRSGGEAAKTSRLEKTTTGSWLDNVRD